MDGSTWVCGRGRATNADALVRFGSKADMCGAPAHVRFTPNSDRESGHSLAPG
jgi:hypothetical protein